MSANAIFLLAGGQSTRLRAIFPDCPKPLVPIHREPYLEKLLRRLRRSCSADIHLLLGYRADKFDPYLQRWAETYGPLFVHKEEMALGTGGSLLAATAAMPKDSIFYVLNADTLWSEELEVFLRQSLQDSQDALLGIVKGSSQRAGQIRFENGQTNFLHEGEGGHIYAGISLLRKKIFNLKNWPESFSLESLVFPNCNRLGAYEFHSPYYDFGTVEAYQELQKTWSQNWAALYD